MRITELVDPPLSTSGATQSPPRYPAIQKKLRALDIFAGAGGLCLRQSGVVSTSWAVESSRQAAISCEENHPGSTVMCGDSNEVLFRTMKGVQQTLTGERIPSGGPPCQGFSGMNRFQESQLYQGKNSLVANFLSHCDFYRPRFFLLENIEDLIKYKGGLVLRLCVRALTKMGYQVAFSVLQAEQYGGRDCSSWLPGPVRAWWSPSSVQAGHGQGRHQ